MDAKLLILKLILEELGIPPSIQTFDDRKRVQKAIYLGQRTGIDLGYRYGWYVKGPYCTDLTSDYYALSTALDEEPKATEGKRLLPRVSASLEKSKPLLFKPKDSSLSDNDDWLELVASVDYLISVSKLDKEYAREKIKAAKPQLVSDFDVAYRTLAEAGFIKA